MKRITIGRNPSCDIMFDQNMVSRNHALLNVYPSGKYEIVNMGSNGTTVNGVKISTGQPYPVKRGDTIVFAGQCALDWKEVPNPAGPWKIFGIVVGGAVVVGLLIWGILWAVNQDWSSDDSEFVSGGSNPSVESPAPADSTVTDEPNVDNKEVTTDNNTSGNNSSTDKKETEVEKKDSDKSLSKMFFPGKTKNDSAKKDETSKDKKKTNAKNSDTKTEKKAESKPKSTNADEDEWHR